MHRSKKRRNIVIISLVAVLLCMVVGYATYSTNLELKGTSEITSNWDIQITDVTNGTPTGNAENAIAPDWDALSASFEANLYDKGDAMEYDVTITNKGTLDAKLDNIITNAQNANTDAVIITFTGYKKGEILKQNESKVVHVKIEYNPNYEGGETSGEVDVDFDFVQDNKVPEQPSTYLLTFDYQTNGGTRVDSEGEYLISGSNVDLSNKAYKDGWTFVGWNTNKNAKEALTSYTMDAASTTLYAIYKKDLKALYQSSDGVNEIGKTEDNCSIFNNETSCNISLPSITPASGYVAGGWYLEENQIGNPGDNYTLTDNVTLTAKATEDVITLSVSTTSTTSSITVVANAEATSGISKYEYSNDGGKTWIDGGTNNTYKFTGLTAGTSYDIQVRVTSASGKTMTSSASIDLTDNVTDTGDGLYKDEYEDGRYFYKGKNVKNYVTFNNEEAGWRIISINSDGTIKIMRDADINTSNTLAWDSSRSNNWNRPASLNTYLNGTYYNSLTTTAQSQIVEATYYVGAVTYDNNDIQDQISDEKVTTSKVKVALPTLSEYIRANSNKEQCGTFSLNNDNYSTTCKNSDWMFNSTLSWWTLSPNSDTSDALFYVDYDGSVYDGSAGNPNYAVRPAITLSSKVQITGGDGSQSNPYTLSMGGTSTSTLEKPTFTEEGVYPKTVTITFPDGCGDTLTCSYQKDNGESISVTTKTVDVEFDNHGSIAATATDGTNTVNSSYTVTIKLKASELSYDNKNTGLDCTDAQCALDAIKKMLE